MSAMSDARAGLVGRDAELAALRTFLDSTRIDGAALLLTGDPGVGKTALLDAAVDTSRAAGMRVIRGSGIEFESELGFAVLHQLVLPLAAELGRLPESQRAALEVALGLEDGSAPSQIAVLNAALGLFAAAAADDPLLLVIDDLHVVDQPSIAAIGFIARRVQGRRIGVLAARRSGPGGAFRPTGVAELDVTPLTDADSLRLLARRFAHLPRSVLSSVAGDAQGNPLALLEFAGTTGASGDRAGWVGGPARDVSALFGARIGRLPERTRDLLLLAALEGSGDLRILQVVGASEGFDDLAAAERDHLVIVEEDDHIIRFRHPLVRSAVVDGSTAEQRRTAHRRLADVLVDQPDRRGVHLAKSTTTPDESVASVVEVAAQTSLRRGDPGGAVAMLRRAAELSPEAEKGRRRLSQAAYVAAWIAGELDTSHELLHALQGVPGGQPIGATAAAAFLVLVTEGDADTAYTMLMPALEAATSVDGPRTGDVEDALFTLTLAADYLGGREYWQPLMDLVGRFPDPSTASAATLARVHHDLGSMDNEQLRRLDAAIDRLRDETDTDIVIRTALVASYVDRLPGCRESVTRVIRDGGAVGSSMPGLIYLALDHLYAARLSAASDAAAELITLSERTGYPLWAQVGHYAAAMAAAERGDLEESIEHCERIWGWSGPRRVHRLVKCAHFARARAALGVADFETAHRHAVEVCTPGELARFNPEAVWAAPDLIEAAVRTGRVDEARAHAEAFRSAGLERISSRLALISGLCTAMASEPDEAVRIHEETLTIPGREQWPFEVGRVHLASGEVLRRQGRARDARRQLDAARKLFADIGARTWLSRANTELRATGMSRARSRSELTPQELEVARLAASGLSNPQIAERLFLSPRTVSSHLYRLFPKLGITSRAALRDALDALAGTD
ncbi:AAA family ATPase [Gordonia rubripertincta]|nr:AAA family ATPase [Gordonia rubripertincta]